MTIDSKYLPRTYEISAGDTEYYFEYESIGGETVKPLVQYTEADGYVWYEDLGGTVTTTYGGRAPLYSRGKFDFISGQDEVYGDLKNAKLYVQRDTEITQLLDLIPYTPFPAEDFEFGLDKLTLILQEIDGEACSCPWGGTEDNPNEPPPPPDPSDPCIVTVPNTDILSTSIWDETGTEPLPTFSRYGMVGVDGDEIIANPAGRTIIHSTDLGETWTVHTDSLPDDPDVAGDAYHLVPTKWQKVDGVWFAHLRSREFNQGSNGSVIGSTVDGSSWTTGNKLNGAGNNGRYSTNNALQDNGQLVLIGRPGAPDDASIWRYDDPYGVTANDSFAAVYNASGQWCNKFGNKYFGIINQASDTAFHAWLFDNSDLAGSEYVNSIASSSNTISVTYQGEVAVIDQGAGAAAVLVLTPNDDTSAPFNTASMPPETVGVRSLASKQHIWLAADKTTTLFGTWTLEYTLESTPTAYQHACEVILPDDQTSSGTNGDSMNIIAASSNWWIGWYRKASDQKLRIIKFEFETYTGDCF